MNVSCPECRSVFRVDPAQGPVGGSARALLGVRRCDHGRRRAARSTRSSRRLGAGSGASIPSASAPAHPTRPVAPTPAQPPPSRCAAAPPAVDRRRARRRGQRSSAARHRTADAAARAPARQRSRPRRRAAVADASRRCRQCRRVPAAPRRAAAAARRPRTPMRPMPPIRPRAPPAMPPPPMARRSSPPAASPCRRADAPSVCVGAPSAARRNGRRRRARRSIRFSRTIRTRKRAGLSRALISDLVTYFPQRRDEGLRDGTLKELFREEIKKSYEEYVDQVGTRVRRSTTHFQEALNEILAAGQKMF